MSYLQRETNQVGNVVATSIISGGLVGFIGAIGTHFATNGLLLLDGSALFPLFPSLGAMLVAAGFVSPPVVRRIIRHRFLSERTR